MTSASGRPESPAATRARQRAAAARRRVVMASLIAVVAAAGVMWVARPVDPPAPRETDDPATDAEAVAEDDAEIALPIPPSDADVLLVNGEAAALVRADSLRADEPVSVDLAVPIRLDEAADTFTVLMMTEGREPLSLEGRVGGPHRNVVRIDLPPGWLVPGSYVVDLKTRERSHFPFRRFALLVD